VGHDIQTVEERIMKVFKTTAVLLALLSITACGGAPKLEIQTYEVKYLDQYQLSQLIEPYIFYDREGPDGMYTLSGNILTVRETSDNLGRIAMVLLSYDIKKPSVRIRVDVIEADGGGVDPAVEDIAARLRELFRFEGYQRVGGGVLLATENTRVEHSVSDERGRAFWYTFSANCGRLSQDDGDWVMNTEMTLRRGDGTEIATTALLREGQTTLVGTSASGQGDSSSKAVILAVRPEFVF